MDDALFPLIFHDGKQGYHKGIISVSPATTFDLFLCQIAVRIPGLDPQHFHIEIVCSRAGAPADARQKIPIHANTNFRVVLNQHSPAADPNAHFMVMLKRPEQRQLEQQRRLINQQQQQQQLHSKNVDGMDRAGPLQQPSVQGPQGPPLKGAAYPWAGNPHLPAPQITPQMQRAWNSTPELSPRLAPGHKTQANMWGAVPQHHQAIPLAQAQHLSAMAQAAANASAQAQAQVMRQGSGVGGPRPVDFGPNRNINLQNGPPGFHAAQSAGLRAAQHAQHTQHGFVVPPPPPPLPGPGPPLSTRPVGQQPLGAPHLLNFHNLGPQILTHTLGSQTSGPQSLGHSALRPQLPGLQTLRSQPLGPQTSSNQPLRSHSLGSIPVGPQAPPAVPMQGADLPFRPMRILTHANAGQLGYGLQASSAQAAAHQDSGIAFCDASSACDVPGSADLSMHNNLASTGGFSNSFWSNSPRDHVVQRDHMMQSLLIKKLNPHGSISSPREARIPSAWNSHSTHSSHGAEV